MTRKNMISTMLVVTMLMVGAVASAETRSDKLPKIDLTLVPQARKAALELTPEQLRKIASVQKTHRQTEGGMQEQIQQLVQHKKEMASQQRLTPEMVKEINNQINKLSKQVHVERDATRMALFRLLDQGQKVRLKTICAQEEYFRPGVRLICVLPVAKLVPDAPETETEPRPEPGPETKPEPGQDVLTGEQFKAKDAVDDARVIKTDPVPNPELVGHEQAEAARLKALVDAEEAKQKAGEKNGEKNGESKSPDQIRAEELEARRQAAEEAKQQASKADTKDKSPEQLQAERQEAQLRAERQEAQRREAEARAAKGA